MPAICRADECRTLFHESPQRRIVGRAEQRLDKVIADNSPSCLVAAGGQGQVVLLEQFGDPLPPFERRFTGRGLIELGLHLFELSGLRLPQFAEQVGAMQLELVDRQLVPGSGRRFLLEEPAGRGRVGD